MEYTANELMIVNAARLLKDGDTVFVGVGVPTCHVTWHAVPMHPTC